MSFKEFDQSKDISSQTSVVNEIIPLTGTFFSGAAGFYTKTYINITSGSVVSGGFWQTIYDGAPASISASALCDITFGISSASLVAGYSQTFMAAEKKRSYKALANLLLGSPSSLFNFNSTNYHEVFAFLLKRRIYKDEVRKGNVSITLQMSGSGANGTDNATLTLTDAGAASAFTVGPAGDEAPLYSGSTAVGRVYYNAGIVVLATGAFIPVGIAQSVYWSGSTANQMNLNQSAITGNIDNVVYGLKNRVNQLTFQNQTNLHSTIYFCRALNSEFNYSTNPTFVDNEGRIIPTSGTDNQTRAYMTKVGLYDINDNLLAAASLSEPVKKSPDSEVVVRVKLSY